MSLFKRKEQEVDMVSITLTDEKSGDFICDYDDVSVKDLRDSILEKDIVDIELEDAKKPKMKRAGLMDMDYMNGLYDMFPDLEDEELRKTIMDACGNYKKAQKSMKDEKSKLLKDAEKQAKETKESDLIDKLFDGEKGAAKKIEKELKDSTNELVKSAERQAKIVEAANKHYGIKD